MDSVRDALHALQDLLCLIGECVCLFAVVVFLIAGIGIGVGTGALTGIAALCGVSSQTYSTSDIRRGSCWFLFGIKKDLFFHLILFDLLCHDISHGHQQECYIALHRISLQVYSMGMEHEWIVD
jgi:hypothetical protein